MTNTEFENKLLQKDIVCMLANMLAEKSPMHIELKYAKPIIINDYIDKALTILQEFNTYGLKITINE